MKIWITRHGQTDLNKGKRMQGLTDMPLNETGQSQADRTGELVRELMQQQSFDAVYASPLGRAVETAARIAGIDQEAVIRDERIIETDFGPYEQRPYLGMGLRMTLYWALPELFSAPQGVETVASMTGRAQDFLKELEQKEYENVLVVCHGGIIRSLCGYLEDRPRGIKWRPKPKNCEVRIYESKMGQHTLLGAYRSENKK